MVKTTCATFASITALFVVYYWSKKSSFFCHTQLFLSAFLSILKTFDSFWTENSRKIWDSICQILKRPACISAFLINEELIAMNGSLNKTVLCYRLSNL